MYCDSTLGEGLGLRCAMNELSQCYKSFVETGDRLWEQKGLCNEKV